MDFSKGLFSQEIQFDIFFYVIHRHMILNNSGSSMILTLKCSNILQLLPMFVFVKVT